MKNKLNLSKINWQTGGGLVPAIIQDFKTNRVLMLGYLNNESLNKTIASGKVWFYSRSKKRLWMKGEQSKNYLFVKDILLDCDRDTLLIKTNPAGPTCHTLKESCFDAWMKSFKEQPADIGILAELFNTIETRRREMPAKSYTTHLFLAGIDKLGAKVMEEAVETYQAAVKDTKQRLIEEGADVLYHLWALLAHKKVTLIEVLKELKKRQGLPPRKLKNSSKC